MAWRFRRSFKIAPGIRANIGKKSASVRVGPRGLGFTTGTAGSRVSAGIPGTGLHVSEKLPTKKASGTIQEPTRQAPPTKPRRRWFSWLMAAILGLLGVGALQTSALVGTVFLGFAFLFLLRALSGRAPAVEPIAAVADTTGTPTGDDRPSPDLRPLGQEEAICPSCGAELERFPLRKVACPHCGEAIYSRTRPIDRKKVLVNATEAAELEEQYAILNGSHEQFLQRKEEREAIRQRLADEFGQPPSEADVQWAVHKEDALRFARARQWGLFRNTRFEMGEMRRKEGDGMAALALFLEVCALDLTGAGNAPSLPADFAVDGVDLSHLVPKVETKLAPGVVRRIHKIASSSGMNEPELASRFDKAAGRYLPLAKGTSAEEMRARFLSQYREVTAAAGKWKPS